MVGQVWSRRRIAGRGGGRYITRFLGGSSGVALCPRVLNIAEGLGKSLCSYLEMLYCALA